MDILSNTLTSTAYPYTTTLSYQSLFPINCERSLCYWYIVNQYLKACLQMHSACNRIKLFTIMVIRLQALCHGKHSSKYSISWGLFDSSSRSTCLNSNYLRLPLTGTSLYSSLSVSKQILYGESASLEETVCHSLLTTCKYSFFIHT